MSERAHDPINRPSHYIGQGLEVIDVIEAWGLGFHLGNAVKYVLRAGRKGDRLEDLGKARWYVARARELHRGGIRPTAYPMMQGAMTAAYVARAFGFAAGDVRWQIMLFVRAVASEPNGPIDYYLGLILDELDIVLSPAPVVA